MEVNNFGCGIFSNVQPLLESSVFLFAEEEEKFFFYFQSQLISFKSKIIICNSNR